MVSQPNTWANGNHEFETARIFEYTAPHVTPQFDPLDALSLQRLISLPCLFAYESGAQQDAHLGYISRAQIQANSVWFEYRIDPTFRGISDHQLQSSSQTLQIDRRRYEFSRTHWAVKDVNLFPALSEAGLLVPVQRPDIEPGVFQIPEEPINPRLVSGMMPFDNDFEPVRQTLTEVCAEFDLVFQRADNIWENHAVIQDIFSLIYRSNIVICDFTGRNTNVFYEAGIAHTLGKSIIPITRHSADIPFDLQHLRHLTYLNNGEGREALKESLRPRIRTLIEAN